MIQNAFINIWGERVGAVAWNPNEGLATFQYDKRFLQSDLDLSPIMMPLSMGQRIHDFPANRNVQTFRGLPGLLADVLPDKYGNALINTWLARQGRPTDSLNPVETLCFIGQRAMGALEFEPTQVSGGEKSTKLELQNLIQVTDQILTGRKDFSTQLGADEEKALIDILKIGTSAGGARAKALIAYNSQTGEVRSGQAEVPEGYSHWLIKFDGVTDRQFGTSSGYGRVEMAYYYMAVEAGIDMMECYLKEENGRAHFMTRRFDRGPKGSPQSKSHVQTFCAMRHFDFNEILLYSYEQLFETMRMLRLDYPQAQELYRRMVFNVMARNCDDHTKNFAFTMDRSGKWRLSPAYDICHAYRPGSDWVSQHALSLNGKRKDHTREDLLQVAHSMNIKNAREIIDRTAEVVSRWDHFAEKVTVEPTLQKAISKTLRCL